MPESSQPTSATSAELVHRIHGGDRSAEGDLVDQFGRGLLLMLRRLTGDLALAEDLQQETFRIVLEKVRSGELRDPDKLPGFLRGTARNLLLSTRRQNARLRTGDGLPLPLDPRHGSQAEEAPQLRSVLRKEEARLVRKLLGEMRFERDRKLLVHFYLSDRSKQEVCEELGVDPVGFKKVLFRARERLRELWERAQKRQRFEETST
ncbi:MAG: sigma-70 family RNA polymerase sigma factor [Acidobacteriota bacterium]